MKYTCSCGFESDDWGEFLRHVFCKEGMKKAHYIIHPSPINKESPNG